MLKKGTCLRLACLHALVGYRMRSSCLGVLVSPLALPPQEKKRHAQQGGLDFIGLQWVKLAVLDGLQARRDGCRCHLLNLLLMSLRFLSLSSPTPEIRFIWRIPHGEGVDSKPSSEKPLSLDLRDKQAAALHPIMHENLHLDGGVVNLLGTLNSNYVPY